MLAWRSMWGTRETLRRPGFVQGHTHGQGQEPGLNPTLCPQRWGTGCAQASWGLLVRCVGVTVWTGYGVEWSPSAAWGHGSRMRKKPGKGNPGSDHTSLTTEHNRIHNPVTRHPHSGDSVLLGLFVWKPAHKQHAFLLCAHVTRLSAQESQQWHCFPILETVCHVSHWAPLDSSLERPKGNRESPRSGQSSLIPLLLTCVAPLPLPMCVSMCGRKGHVWQAHLRRYSLIKGQMPGGWSCSQPRSRLAERDRVLWGFPRVPKVHPETWSCMSLHPGCRAVDRLVIWEHPWEKAEGPWRWLSRSVIPLGQQLFSAFAEDYR